ncbi:MAG: phage portal protein [Pseudomonadota bacterium]
MTSLPNEPGGPPSESDAARGVVEKKSVMGGAIGPLVALQHAAAPAWSPRSYAAFAREGVMQNAVVHRSVRMICEAVASVGLVVRDGDAESDAHPLLTLLRQPNQLQCRATFLEALVGYLLVSGNAFVEAVRAGDDVRELYLLRPDRVRVVTGTDGWVTAYDHTVDGRTVRRIAEDLDGFRAVHHVRFFHPLDEHYGLSPIEAAAMAVDIHNKASAWNKALLDNAARPSGALVYAANDGNMTADQYERLRDQLEASFQGARNAGRPLLLEGGLDWKAMGFSPKDMDFIEAKNVAAREIALALGVPPMLLGIPGDNTYANFQEANRTFWRQTVVPLAERIAKGLGGWLAPMFANGSADMTLKVDLAGLTALASEREALWSRIGAADFLSLNEKRGAAGFPPVPGGDDIPGAYADAAR